MKDKDMFEFAGEGENLDERWIGGRKLSRAPLPSSRIVPMLLGNCRGGVLETVEEGLREEDTVEDLPAFREEDFEEVVVGSGEVSGDYSGQMKVCETHGSLAALDAVVDPDGLLE